MIVYFKKLWKKEIKNAWFYFCLINISEQPNKFVPNDQFKETIIILNKQNINPSANAKSDEFFQETISQNVLSLWNSIEVLLQATESTSHSNHHLTIGSFPDVCYLIKLLANKSAFCEYLKRGNSKFLLPDLFANGTKLLAKRIALAEYISSS